MNLLAGKTALITGASRGIGKKTSEIFAQNGIDTLILLARDSKRLEEIKKRIKKTYKSQVITVKADIGKSEEIKFNLDKIKKENFSIDILVNNAGIMLPGTLMMMKESDIEKTYKTNVLGSIIITKLIISSMLRNRNGSIINISSIIGTRGNAGNSIYASSKSAIIGFTRSLSKELAPLNIRVNAVAPGFIETDMTANLNSDEQQKYVSNIAMKRIGRTEDVANVILFLASDLSGYVTGQVIGVDGGMVI